MEITWKSCLGVGLLISQRLAEQLKEGLLAVLFLHLNGI